MTAITLTFSITIQASQRAVFEYLSDWERQSDWIMFTTVKQLPGATSPRAVNLLAITKFGPIKLIDTMVITDWQPCERIAVEHTGRVILGKGVFSVKHLSDDSCLFTWQEITPVPFGLIGKLGLFFFQPLIRLPFQSSLRKLKHKIEST